MRFGETAGLSADAAADRRPSIDINRTAIARQRSANQGSRWERETGAGASPARAPHCQKQPRGAERCLLCWCVSAPSIDSPHDGASSSGSPGSLSRGFTHVSPRRHRRARPTVTGCRLLALNRFVAFFLRDATNPESCDRLILTTRLPGTTTSLHAVSLPTPATTFGLRPLLCRRLAAQLPLALGNRWKCLEICCSGSDIGKAPFRGPFCLFITYVIERKWCSGAESNHRRTDFQSCGGDQFINVLAGSCRHLVVGSSTNHHQLARPKFLRDRLRGSETGDHTHRMSSGSSCARVDDDARRPQLRLPGWSCQMLGSRRKCVLAGYISSQ